jgi:hypothetical protein
MNRGSKSVKCRWKKNQLQGKPVKFAFTPIEGFFNVIHSDSERMSLQVVSSLEDPKTVHWVTQEEADALEVGTDGTFFISR